MRVPVGLCIVHCALVKIVWPTIEAIKACGPLGRRRRRGDRIFICYILSPHDEGSHEPRADSFCVGTELLVMSWTVLVGCNHVIDGSGGRDDTTLQTRNPSPELGKSPFDT